MSTGVWPTNQSTGAQIGATGYSGFGIANQLDNSHMFFGNGVISATDTIAVPGFTGQLAACFDTCKIVRIDYKIWYQGQAEVFGGGNAKQSPTRSCHYLNLILNLKHQTTSLQATQMLHQHNHLT